MTVDKNQLLSLVKRYYASTSEEAEAVLELKSQFPYSQVLHALAAKVSSDHDLQNHQAEIQMAAIYAADRGVLKEIITRESEVEEAEESIEVTDAEEVHTALQVETFENQPAAKADVEIKSSERSKEVSVVYHAAVESPNSSLDVADQVMQDLEKLNSLRHNFEMMFVEYAELKSDSSPAKAEKHFSKEKESIKSKKERIIEMAKSVQADGVHEKSQREKRSEIKVSPNEELIKEIISNKQEIAPENQKQKDQIDIINEFIKTQPSITSAKDRQPAAITDLNPVKTGEFGENIVSETLVEILLKQGKKDKAIEVLKKLIWKYPQKKAYFASQIEDLKK